MLFNPSQADPPSQVEVQVPGGVVPQGDMDRVMAFSEGLVEGWSLGGRKIADWYPGFPRGERVRYCGSPQIVEGLRLRGVRDGRRGGLLV
ncbi:hypothetical protein V7F90_06255, partial [Cutibacterium avidum]